MRIYEFAKAKNISSKEIIEILEKKGFVVTSHMSVLTNEMEQALAIDFDHDAKKKNEKDTKSKVVNKDDVTKEKNQTEKKEPIIHASQENKTAQQYNKNNAEAPLSSRVIAEVKKSDQDIFITDNPDILNLLEGVANFDSGRSSEGKIVKGKQIKASAYIKGFAEEGAHRRRSKKSYQKKQERAQREVSVSPRVVSEIIVSGDLVLEEAAHLLGKPSGELIVSLLKKGMACTKNHLLSEAIVIDLAHQYGIKVITENNKAQQVTGHVSQHCKQKGIDRWPIVVVVGHVDHGKTTFLDTIRKANVAAREKGGITQHIGAYEVESTHGKIVFLDTPGHEAFSFLRARGIKVTDIAILMVAADDGVMPQTVEAIKAAQDAGVTIIVAINKIDKVGSTAPIESIKRELAQHDLLVEDWGGSIICAPISAKTGQGIPELLEMITLQAQMMDLKADPQAQPRAFVLESSLDKGYGPVATVILVEGTLKVGDFFHAGETTGKVRLLIKSDGTRVQEVGPSVPIQVVGFDKYAPLGEWLHVVNAQDYAQIKAGKLATMPTALSFTAPTFQEGQDKDDTIIRVVIKVDTHGTSEAIGRIIATLSKQNKEIARRLQVINISIGNISENDILFAENVRARIVGLHVKVEKNAQSVAKEKKITIVLYDVIYHLTEGLEALIQESRKAVVVSTKVGEAVVRKVFPLKNNTAIAGCYVTDGIVPRNAKVICMRGKQKIGEGKITSLQRDKKVVKEVHSGYECGFLTDQFHDWQEGDIVQCFTEKKEMPQ